MDEAAELRAIFSVKDKKDRKVYLDNLVVSLVAEGKIKKAGEISKEYRGRKLSRVERKNGRKVFREFVNRR